VDRVAVMATKPKAAPGAAVAEPAAMPRLRVVN
jgi:hypothetical protein